MTRNVLHRWAYRKVAEETKGCMGWFVILGASILVNRKDARNFATVRSNSKRY